MVSGQWVGIRRSESAFAKGAILVSCQIIGRINICSCFVYPGPAGGRDSIGFLRILLVATKNRLSAQNQRWIC